jgi:5-methylcytosine-specific restriction endonuclease McrA
MSWDTSDRGSRLPADWPSIRDRILLRDNWTCRMNLPGCVYRASEVDHIRRGDDHRDENLRAACPPCHAKKSSREGHDAKRSIRARRRRPTSRHPGALV